MIQVISTNDSMEPILKANLLQQVLEAGVRGSHCLKTAFQRHLEWFNQQRINSFANWLDPADVTVGIARSEAARKLRDFPDIVLPGRAAADQGLADRLDRRGRVVLRRRRLLHAGQVHLR